MKFFGKGDGWEKAFIISYLEDELEYTDLDETLTFTDISTITDEECQWFADETSIAEYEGEEDRNRVFSNIAHAVLNRIVARLGKFTP